MDGCVGAIYTKLTKKSYMKVSKKNGAFEGVKLMNAKHVESRIIIGGNYFENKKLSISRS